MPFKQVCICLNTTQHLLLSCYYLLNGLDQVEHSFKTQFNPTPKQFAKPIHDRGGLPTARHTRTKSKHDRGPFTSHFTNKPTNTHAACQQTNTHLSVITTKALVLNDADNEETTKQGQHPMVLPFIKKLNTSWSFHSFRKGKFYVGSWRW